MRKKQIRENSIPGVFVLIAFGVFVAAILLVLMYGVKIYRECVERDSDSFETRTVSQYLVTKVRHADENGAISVGSFSDDYKDIDTLFIKETFDGEEYVTRVYCRDGYIMELFAEEAEEVDPDEGNEVIECKSLSFSKDKNMISATIVDDTDTVTNEYIMIRSEKK
ncbi:MAG: DUF4860 domain-containing protein [Lachnospiraceae bacterium]|nr:DUF4860 domain-containing protein [Lachnospiraceae bacterium]